MLNLDKSFLERNINIQNVISIVILLVFLPKFLLLFLIKVLYLKVSSMQFKRCYGISLIEQWTIIQDQSSWMRFGGLPGNGGRHELQELHRPPHMLLTFGIGKSQRSIQQPNYAAWLVLQISFLLQVLTLAPASKFLIRVHQSASGEASSMGNYFSSQKPKISRYMCQWKTEQMSYHLSQGQRYSSLFHVETLGPHGSLLLLECVSTA